MEKIQYLNRINYNIELLLNHLSDITERMLLAKINVIPKFILNQQEISKFKKILEVQNNTVKTEQNIYDFLKIIIIVSIKAPIFKQPIYTLARLVPLPLNNSYFIVTPNYLIYNVNNKTYYITEFINFPSWMIHSCVMKTIIPMHHRIAHVGHTF